MDNPLRWTSARVPLAGALSRDDSFVVFICRLRRPAISGCARRPATGGRHRRPPRNSGFCDRGARCGSATHDLTPDVVSVNDNSVSAHRLALSASASRPSSAPASSRMDSPNRCESPIEKVTAGAQLLKQAAQLGSTCCDYGATPPPIISERRVRVPVDGLVVHGIDIETNAGVPVVA